MCLARFVEAVRLSRLDDRDGAVRRIRTVPDCATEMLVAQGE
jgi:hypothetical protein